MIRNLSFSLSFHLFISILFFLSFHYFNSYFEYHSFSFNFALTLIVFVCYFLFGKLLTKQCTFKRSLLSVSSFIIIGFVFWIVCLIEPGPFGFFWYSFLMYNPIVVFQMHLYGVDQIHYSFLFYFFQWFLLAFGIHSKKD